MREFARFYRVILGLNRKEATEVANVRRLQLGKPAEEADLEEIVTALGEDLGLWCLMVHPVSAAGAYLEGQYFEVEGPLPPSRASLPARGQLQRWLLPWIDVKVRGGILLGPG